MFDNDMIAAKAGPGAIDQAGLQAFFSEFFKDRPMLESCFPRCDAGELGWMPQINVQETAEEVVYYLALPGVEKQAIRLEASQAGLLVSGRRDAGAQAGRWLRREVFPGPFERRLPLPAGTRADLAKAFHKDGILEIRIPKHQAEETMTVEIH